jgi:putative transposase
MRFRSIEDRRFDYPVKIMCGVLGVSPAGYCAWRARPESQRSVTNPREGSLIQRITREVMLTVGR